MADSKYCNTRGNATARFVMADRVANAKRRGQYKRSDRKLSVKSFVYSLC